MPSTATTNITLGTLLDLIGSHAVSAPAADGPPFDALLQNEPPRQSERLDQQSPASNVPGPSLPYTAGPTRQSETAETADQEPQESDRLSDKANSAPTESRPGDDDPWAENEATSDPTESVIADYPVALPLVAPVFVNLQPQQPIESSVADQQEIVEAVETKSERKTGRHRAPKHEVSIATSIDGENATPLPAAATEPTNVEASKSVVAEANLNSNTSPSGEGGTERSLETPLLSVEAAVEPATASGIDPFLQDPSAASAVTLGVDAPTKTDRSETHPLNGTNLETTSQAADQTAAKSANAPTVAAAVPVQPSASSSSTTASTNPSHTAAIGSTPSTTRGRLPADFLSQRTTGTARPGTIEIDSARLLSRVARAFAAAQERDGEIRLRLSPPELGSLRLEVRVQDGSLVARLQTETEAARTAIIDNLPALRDRLNEQGVRIERFDVDLMQRQPGGMPDQTGGGQHETPTPGMRVAPAPRPRSEPSVNAPTSVPSAASSTNGLNVII